MSFSQSTFHHSTTTLDYVGYRLAQNDLLCVEWDIKPYSLTMARLSSHQSHTAAIQLITMGNYRQIFYSC